MRKTLLTLFAALLTAGHVSAQSSKLSPYTRIYLQQHKTEVQQQRAKAASGKSAGAGSVRDSIDTFLKLNDGCDVSEIESVSPRGPHRPHEEGGPRRRGDPRTRGPRRRD